MKIYPIMIVFAFVISLSANQKKFNSLWYDGNAEISTYSLKESRYGENREGTRVMVFVTEPMRLATHIKPDVKLPDDQMIKIIKLNDHRSFNTGIYDYNVMTSLFTSVENKAPYGNMSTMKVSFSSQEWCGQVFERFVRKPNLYEGVLFSYFESAGEEAYAFDAQDLETEDNLWLRIRELNGSFLNSGESKKIKVIPSRWITRKTHVPSVTVDAVVSKGSPQMRETVFGKIETVEYKWTIENESTRVIVETAYPRRILEFRERDGSSGKLMVSQREPYWKQNSSKFDYLRKDFGL